MAAPVHLFLSAALPVLVQRSIRLSDQSHIHRFLKWNCFNMAFVSLKNLVGLNAKVFYGGS